MSVVRIRVDLSYDGTEFAGWAKQPNQRTVQAELEAAFQQILQLPEPPLTICGGRTDAGVHARGQVVHVDLPSQCLGERLQLDLAVGQLRHRLHAVTPTDISVASACLAPTGFDARFSALSRTYRYRVCDDPAAMDPWRRRDTLVYTRPLAVADLNAACQVILGEHDFAAFCRRKEGATTIRRVLEASWERQSDSVLKLRITADAFCRSMVRSLVGAFLMVGDGRGDPEWLRGYLEAGIRGPGPNVAAPQGLVLDCIEYPIDAELASRAMLTRALRQLPHEQCS